MQQKRTLTSRDLARRWALAEAERDVLVRVARGRGLSQADAEDCVHEAMLRVIVRPDLDEARIGALLTTVVVRAAIDFHRRAKTTDRVVAKAAAIITSRPDGDPATVVCDRDEGRWTARLVERLPASQRRVLWARAEGTPVNDIATEMATSAKAIESLISRARAATRSAMASGLSAGFAFVRRLKALPHSTSATAAAGAMAVVLALPAFHGPSAPGGPESGAGGAPQAVALAAAAPASSTAPASSSGHGGAGASAGGRQDEGRGVDPAGGAAAAARPMWTIQEVDQRAETPDATVEVSAGVGKKPGNETDQQKIERCARYGPTVGWTPESFPLPDDGHICRYEPGSPLWR